MKVRKFDLHCANLGNGTTIFNRLKEVHGDSEIIAHNDIQVSWRIKNPPKNVIDYVKEVAKDYQK